jgi:hypothetical protein
MSVRRPAPGKPLVTWIAYRIGGAKAAQLGHVEAPDQDAAIAAAAAEFGVPPARIIVQRIGSG